jgi:putative aldouronate transport system permease protein
MDSENLAALLVGVISLLVIGVFALILRGPFANPLQKWYLALVKKSNHIGATHPIHLFHSIDILYGLLYAAVLFGIVWLWGLGFLPCAIVVSLFAFYRVFFYQQIMTSVFTDIYKDKKATKGDKATDTLGVIFLVIFVILVVVPILNLIAKAFSNGAYNSQVTFVPVHFTFYSFIQVFNNAVFWNSFKNSVILTISVTIFSNIFMGMAGYCLSKKDFPFRNFFIIFYVITMLFSAGIIPTYLLMSQLHLLDSIWGLIVISLNNVFNLLLYKTAFENVPVEIEESARVDGCNSLQLFFRIMVPMILPTVASCCFFSVVGAWNSYGGALMFINKESEMPLSLYIYRLLTNTATNLTNPDTLINYQNIQAASIIISVVPILLIYPYIIRYIKSGLTVGSVKG